MKRPTDKYEQVLGLLRSAEGQLLEVELDIRLTRLWIGERILEMAGRRATFALASLAMAQRYIRMARRIEDKP